MAHKLRAQRAQVATFPSVIHVKVSTSKTLKSSVNDFPSDFNEYFNEFTTYRLCDAGTPYQIPTTPTPAAQMT